MKCGHGTEFQALRSGRFDCFQTRDLLDIDQGIGLFLAHTHPGYEIDSAGEYLRLSSMVGQELYCLLDCARFKIIKRF